MNRSQPQARGTTSTSPLAGGVPSAQVPRSWADAHSALTAAVVALGHVSDVLVRAGESELAQLMGVVDQVCSAADAARVAVATEVASRGMVDTVREAGAWVAEHAPSTRQDGTARAVAAVACRAARVQGWGSTPDAVGSVTDTLDDASPFGVVHGAVTRGELSSRSALAALGMLDRLSPHVRPEMLGACAQGMVTVGAAHGAAEMGRLKAALVAQYGREGEYDRRAEELSRAASMSSPLIASDDLTEYRLFATPEQSATIEAAIGPLSAPKPNPVTGERDSRPAGQRRIEALVTVLGRYSAQAADAAGGAAGSKVALHVTVPLADLVAVAGVAATSPTATNLTASSLTATSLTATSLTATNLTATSPTATSPTASATSGVARVGMSRAAGTLLSPGAIRRLACEAEIVPTVLGTRSEILDIAVPARLFTRGQKQLVWQRDRHCTYPGCDAPPAWCEAHHVLHWLDGGPTRTSNAALLCSRHHHVVHSRRLWADVLAQPDDDGRSVVWDLRFGSYDAALRARASIPEPA